MNLQFHGLLWLSVFSCNYLFAATRPADIYVGPVTITPSVQVEQGYDDNIFGESFRYLKKDSFYTVITPVIEARAEDRLNAYRSRLTLNRGIYHSSSDDNFLDYDLSFDAHVENDARNTFDLNLYHQQVHESRGSGLSEFANVADGLSAPLKYNKTAASATYQHGAGSAKAQLTTGFGYSHKRYQNFREITAFRDTDTYDANLNLRYQAFPKTSLLLETRYQKVNYILDYDNSLDSHTWRGYAGLNWQASAKTTGIFKLGQFNRDHSSALRDDFHGNSWEMVVLWSPRTYSTFRFATSQSEQETTSNSDFIDSDTFRLNWRHSWNDRLLTNINLAATHDKFIGSANNRVDDTQLSSIGVAYDMRRWLSLGATLTHQNTESNVQGIPFDRNIFEISVEGSL